MNIIKKTVLLAFGLAMASGCGDENNFTPYNIPISAANANVKFIHAAVGPLTGTTSTNFQVNYFVNDKKTTAILAPAILPAFYLPLGIGYANQFPSTNNYITVEAGTINLKAVEPEKNLVPPSATATIPASTKSTSTVTYDAGKNYSTFLIGMSPNYEILNLKDDLSPVSKTASTAFVRFLNLVPNGPAAGYDFRVFKLIPATPLLPATRVELINSFAVGYKSNQSFMPVDAIPFSESASYVYELRVPGSPLAFVFQGTANFAPRAGRAYTVFASGMTGLTPATNTSLPRLYISANN
jgi:Domain of unknown function (DUF4397)